VGDVCGKGVQAAALTVLARHTLRTCLVLGHSPLESLTELNRAILRRTPGDRFVTAIAAVACPKDDGLELTLCLAGHPEPLVHRESGSLETAGHPGTLLGVLPKISITQTTVTLARGDTLVLFTDGATDIRGHNGRLGEDRFYGMIGSAPRRPLELVDSIAAAFDEYSDTAVADDIVVLAVSPEPVSEEAKRSLGPSRNQDTETTDNPPIGGQTQR
jgi:serine phosphatase RsbU (regulator of sigma subunit)